MSVIKKIFIYLAALYVTSVYAQQQRVVFEHYKADNIGSSSLIRGMMQDREGYIWFGTSNAIHRFDGFSFNTFRFENKSKEVFAKGYVNAIYEDSRGDFWIGSQGGLQKLNRKTGEFKEYFLSDTQSTVYKFDIQFICEDINGTVWIGSMMGLFIFDSLAQDLKPYISPKYKDLISNVAFRSYALDNDSNLWFGTGIGLFKLDKFNNELVPVWIEPNASLINSKTWNTVDYAIQSILKDNQGYLWCGSLGGTLLKTDPFTGKFSTFNLKDTITLENFPIQSIAPEDEFRLWLATYSGLLLIDKNSGRILEHHVHNDNYKESLSDDKLTSVMKDSSGALWTGSLTGGINKLNRTKIPFRNIIRATWAADRTYSQVPFADMLINREGALLAGTANGIEEIKPGFNDVIMQAPNSAINVLMEDRIGNLWIAVKQYSGGGLYKKDTQGNITSITDNSGMELRKEIQCLFESSSGRIFFSSDFNLYEIGVDKNTAELVFKINRRIYRIAEDFDNTLCLGTMAGGLYFFDPDSKTVKKQFLHDAADSSSITDNSVSEVFLDSKQRLWIGTSNGLNEFIRDENKFRHYDHSFGLAHNLIYKILEDNSGNLWLGTGVGISKFNPETELFKNYDVSYGLVEGPHYIGVKSTDGHMFFKARTGITYFYPDSIKDNSYVPPVVITEMRVLNNPYPFSEEMELSYSENYISLEFAALSYISPEKNMYLYKMEGVDKDWVSSENRRYATYTSLDPGEYVFHVKASNNDGVWNEEGTSVRIKILPPWYKTWWAYSIYVLLFGIAVYGWRRYDLNRQNLKFQLTLEHENVQRHEEISRLKTRFFTNISHEFRTPLTLILGPAESILTSTQDPGMQKKASLIRKNASQLLGLVNQLLDISKLDEGKLRLQVSKGDLAAFVKGITMIFEAFAERKDIILRVKSENNIDGYFDKEKLEKILINIISNALKFTPEGGQVTVYVSQEGDNAKIIVNDTGPGINKDELPKLFDRFYQVDSSHTREHGGTGIGLALTKELVGLHKGSIHVDSIPGEWTEFTVIIPIMAHCYQENEIILYDDSELYDNKYTILTGNTLQDESSVEMTNGNGNHNDEEGQLILIVEDNSDVREYIKDTLGTKFIIEEAVNGEQGFRKAEALIPDLIISDIMMPVMDGYELTRKIREDEKTNHIPVILLTAKTDHKSKLEGFESGAEAYLTKPFDQNELRIRVNKMIEIRKKLQEKYGHAEKIQLKENDEIKPDLINEKFINKVIEVMDKHLSEEEFSIEDFSHELCMSRAQLHRKLKALTGKSASRYLRSYRLSAARKMIEAKKGTISEIAYYVGFASPIYFSKCFKDEYGYSPSEHLN